MRSCTPSHIPLVACALTTLSACTALADADSTLAMESDGSIEGTYLERYRPELATEFAALESQPCSPLVTTIAAAGPGDRDGDGLADAIDTCPDDADPSNFDADGDGLGNACDADYDGNGSVAASDFAAFIAAQNTVRGDAAYDSRADHDGNGAVNLADYAILLRHFGAPPPRLDGVVPFETVRAGDRLVIVTRYGAGLGSQISALTVSAVTRSSSGKVRSIDAPLVRLTALAGGAWMIENLGVVSAPFIQISCPRAVIFPDRPVGGTSQLCTPASILSISISVSRP